MRPKGHRAEHRRRKHHPARQVYYQCAQIRNAAVAVHRRRHRGRREHKGHALGRERNPKRNNSWVTPGTDTRTSFHHQRDETQSCENRKQDPFNLSHCDLPPCLRTTGGLSGLSTNTSTTRSPSHPEMTIEVGCFTGTRCRAANSHTLPTRARRHSTSTLATVLRRLHWLDGGHELPIIGVDGIADRVLQPPCATQLRWYRQLTLLQADQKHRQRERVGPVRDTPCAGRQRGRRRPGPGKGDPHSGRSHVAGPAPRTRW